jgi:hypothetical protein
MDFIKSKNATKARRHQDAQRKTIINSFYVNLSVFVVKKNA